MAGTESASLGPCGADGAVRRLLVAVGESAPGDQALIGAISIARRQHATITLVASTDRPGGLLEAWALGLAPYLVEEYREASALDELAHAANQVPRDLGVRTILRRGSLGREMIKLARSGEFDALLVSIGCEGRSIPWRGLVRAMTRGSRIPVLTFADPEA